MFPDEYGNFHLTSHWSLRGITSSDVPSGLLMLNSMSSFASFPEEKKEHLRLARLLFNEVYEVNKVGKEYQFLRFSVFFFFAKPAGSVAHNDREVK